MFKNIVITVILGMLTFIPVQTCGQTQTQKEKEVAKERKETKKSSQAKLNKKASKFARKEAKRMKKEGWEAISGIPSIELQLEKLYSIQSEYNENNCPKYRTSAAISIAETYRSAQMQAFALAEFELVEKIKLEAIALIDKQISEPPVKESEDSLTQIILSMPLNIGRVITIMEVYRTKDNQKKEVMVSIACDSDMAWEALKKGVREVLEKQDNEFANHWDKLFQLCK